MPRLNVSPLHRRKLGVVVTAITAGLLLTQCGPKDEPAQTPAAAVPETPVVVTPTLPAGAPPLTRADLLAATARAASTYAAGETPTGSDPLVGRPFAVRMAFGCGGPIAEPQVAAASPDGLPLATWGTDHKSIQLSLTPGEWFDSALIAGAGAEATWETVEGFWVPRPWLTSEACPAVRRDPLQGAGAAPSTQTVGLAAVFAKGSSRLAQRNGRAYRYTVRAEGDRPLVAPEGGYRVVLEGRVVGFPGGGAIRCRASGPDQRPVCVAAVQLDRVAFESATGTALGEWRKG